MSLTSQLSMFGFDSSDDGSICKRKRMVGEILEIDYNTASDFLLQRHYSGRVPSISKAFGWYVGGGC